MQGRLPFSAEDVHGTREPKYAAGIYPTAVEARGMAQPLEACM